MSYSFGCLGSSQMLIRPHLKNIIALVIIMDRFVITGCICEEIMFVLIVAQNHTRRIICVIRVICTVVSLRQRSRFQRCFQQYVHFSRWTFVVIYIHPVCTTARYRGWLGLCCGLQAFSSCRREIDHLVTRTQSQIEMLCVKAHWCNLKGYKMDAIMELLIVEYIRSIRLKGWQHDRYCISKYSTVQPCIVDLINGWFT